MRPSPRKTVTFNIVSSTYANFTGEAQERTIDKLRRVHQHEFECGGRARLRDQYLQKSDVNAEPGGKLTRELQPFGVAVVCPGTIGHCGVALYIGSRL